MKKSTYKMTAIFVAGLISCCLRAQQVDCTNKSISNSDHAICDSPELTNLDKNVVDLLADRAGESAVDESQRAWISGRARCNGNQSCIEQAYQSRITYLKSLPPQSAQTQLQTVSPLPGVPEEASTSGDLQASMPAENQSSAGPESAASVSLTDGRTTDQLLDSAAGNTPAPVDSGDGIGLFGWLLIVLVVIGVPMGIWYGITELFGRCPSCHKWNSRKLYDRDNEHYTGFRDVNRESVRRNRDGIVVARTSTTAQEAFHVNEYTNYYVCPSCKHKWARSGKTTR